MAPQSRVTGDVISPDIIPVTGAVSSPSHTPSSTPSSTPSPAPSPNDGSINNDTNNNNLSQTEGFGASGTYIYMIMSVSILVTVVFFARVCLAKRKEKERRHKEFECEEMAVPPGYEFHLIDIALYNARALGAGQSASNSNSPATYNSVAPSASSADILSPPPTAWIGTGRHSTAPADPPTYESLLTNYAFAAPSASASSNSLPSSHPPRRPL